MAKNLLDELDLEDLAPTRILGAVPKTFHVEHARDLTEADLGALSAAHPSPPQSLRRIHASHHSLARCLATGMKSSHAALVTGYTVSRVETLKADPAFQALIGDYQTESKSVIADMTERLTNISVDALELLQDRINDSPEALTVPVLIDIIKMGADRTGHGPGQEVSLRLDQNFIDRPPRETHAEWEARRNRELEKPAAEPGSGTLDVNLDDLKRLN